MATSQLQFRLTIEGIGYDDTWPAFEIYIDQDLQDRAILQGKVTYNFDVDLEDGDHSLRLALINKQDSDTCVENGTIVKDKAIVVHPLEIEGYTLDNFMHLAVYYPVNRDPLNSTYLGWNGVWQLDFSTPIYSWIHRTQQLGWIY